MRKVVRSHYFLIVLYCLLWVPYDKPSMNAQVYCDYVLSIIDNWPYMKQKAQFRSSILPDLSNITWYWEWPFSAKTTPDLSHFFAFGPIWFWTMTMVPGANDRWSFVPLANSSPQTWCLLANTVPVPPYARPTPYMVHTSQGLREKQPGSDNWRP